MGDAIDLALFSNDVTMKKRAEYLYSHLLQDMDHCKRKGFDTKREAECCFHIADKYWAILKHEVVHYDFSNEQDEIDFFRVIKPKFTSEIEYYNLVFHMSLPLPDDPVSHEYLWRIEAQRLKKFIQSNQEFYDYYKSGRNDRDHEYFIRVNSDLSNFPKIKVYDMDSRANTSHDSLVASLIALERYDRYVAEQLDKLKKT
jgi:hypothetical protein